MRKALLDYEAALPGNKNDDIEFLAKLFDGANAMPLIATNKPGFTDCEFRRNPARDSDLMSATVPI